MNPLLPISEKFDPQSISRSGDKYWLGSDGSLHQTREHSQGAKRLADSYVKQADLKKVGIDPDRIPMTFGLKEMFDMGWLRLVTEKNVIWVTGNSSQPKPNSAQKRTLKDMRERFMVINKGTEPDVLYGDGGSRSGKTAVAIGASSAGIIDKLSKEYSPAPSFYTRKGRKDYGESINLDALMDQAGYALSEA